MFDEQKCRKAFYKKYGQPEDKILRGVNLQMYSAFKAGYKSNAYKWLPIEDAPKDEKIDIYHNGKRFTGCYHDAICDEWRITTPDLKLKKIGHHKELVKIGAKYMPLPQPPEESGK